MHSGAAFEEGKNLRATIKRLHTALRLKTGLTEYKQEKLLAFFCTFPVFLKDIPGIFNETADADSMEARVCLDKRIQPIN